MKNYPKAIADIKKLSELFPQNGMYSNYLAETYTKSANYKEASNTYTKIINNQPPSDNNKFTFTKRAESFYKLGDFGSASADLAKVETFYPKEKSKVEVFTLDATLEFYLLKEESILHRATLLMQLKIRQRQSNSIYLNLMVWALKYPT